MRAAMVNPKLGRAAATPRRITRSSLSRLAHANGSVKEEETELSFGSDIEDAISSTAPRKRRRVSNGRSIATREVKVEIKGEVKSEVKSEDTDATATLPPSKPAAKGRRDRKPARIKVDPDTGEVSVTPPSNWEEMYNVVLEMRQPGGVASNAAVDTMGCERLADRGASERDQRFHTLIALMLSSQTKDTTNAVVMKKLQTELPACKPGAPVGLNLENILAVDPEVLNQMIWAVGFHNNKTK